MVVSRRRDTHTARAPNSTTATHMTGSNQALADPRQMLHTVPDAWYPNWQTPHKTPVYPSVHVPLLLLGHAATPSGHGMKDGRSEAVGTRHCPVRDNNVRAVRWPNGSAVKHSAPAGHGAHDVTVPLRTTP